MRSLDIVGLERGIFVPTREKVTKGGEHFMTRAIKFVFLKNIPVYIIRVNENVMPGHLELVGKIKLHTEFLFQGQHITPFFVLDT
jgi:hypothetical protein